ncbi:MAG: lipolytic enzyme, G-D-S-L [Angelakisella sp.]|jgi:lysophospholipase L1-like esterase|nr:lipolytic enzyme, G-D-S-L [Angelakisella sp.]
MKKHIVCIGDSNTHGYCADPADCADGGIRFNEEERWTCRLQAALGPDYLVTEEGLSGRTTVFPDPLHESMDALGVLYALLKSHEVVDLLIIMLGTNDVKERLGMNASCIGIGMERLVRKAQSVDCWGEKKPNILIVCPPAILPEMELSEVGQPMGKGCIEKSRELPQYLEKAARLTGAHYLNAAECEFNRVDGMHLTRQGHARLAELLARRVPELVEAAK